MDAGDIASTIVGALGLVGGVIGFFVAQRARHNAESAQVGAQIAGERAAEAAEDAARALRESATAAADSAEALKRANEIAEEQLPSKEPLWIIRQYSRGMWAATNESPGRGVARGALIEGAGEAPGLIRPDEVEPRDVPAGDYLTFTCLRVSGPDPWVRISHLAPDGERVSAERKLVF